MNPMKEKIKVFVRIKDGKTICICPRSSKRCNRPCERDTVERDKLNGWEDTFHRDRYGK